MRGASLLFAVEATDQLVRKARTFLRREAKNVGKNVSRAHAKYSTDFRRSVFPPAQHAFGMMDAFVEAGGNFGRYGEFLHG